MSRIKVKSSGAPAFAVGLLLAVSLLLVGAQLVVAQQPRADFTFTPQAPLPGQTVTFTATGLKPNSTVSWDFENDGRFDATGTQVQHVYATGGQRTVRMRVVRQDDDPVEVLKTVTVNTSPTASFTASPNPATVGETVQLNASGSSDPDGTIASYAWDLDNDGQFDDASGVTASRSFGAAGTYTVGLRVTDNRGSTGTAASTVTVNSVFSPPPPPPPNQPPVASFTASPNPATVGETVQFNASGSSDPDGTIASYAWDLDNDGQFDDASGVTASRSFGAAGGYTVRLRVIDNRGATDAAASVVTVNSASVPGPPPPPNQPPVASFTTSPNPATVGETVRFNASGSSDPDGTIASYAWDLDNDGQFDDASGATASRSFAAAGSYTVGLHVADNRGATDTATFTVTVNPTPVPPAAPLNQLPPIVVLGRSGPSPPRVELMRPFPVVRMVGRSTRFWSQIRLLVVRGVPTGATVTVRCRGRRCRLRQKSRYMRSASVRFRSFERRVRPGVRIQVYVTQPGRIGKYTSFKIRRRRAPLRRDLCVTSLTARPQPCPMS